MKRFVPLGILILAVALLAAAQAGYVARGKTLSDAAELLLSIGLALAFVLWMVADARTRRQTPCYDFGFLVALFFPVSLLWYVVWSRGWKGTFMLPALLGLLVLPWLAAVAAWILRYGLP
jgi:hypothetical protein